MQLIILATFILRTAYAATMQEKIEGAFFGSLVADALTLGSHYEYDAPTIKKAYGGIISEYMAPGEQMGGTTHGVGWGRRNYHPGVHLTHTTALSSRDWHLFPVIVDESNSRYSSSARYICSCCMQFLAQMFPRGVTPCPLTSPSISSPVPCLRISI